MQPRVGSLFRPIDLRVSRRTALVGLVLLLLLLLLFLLLAPLAFSNELQFTDPQGGQSVMAGPKGTVSYQVTLENESIIPIQLAAVEAVRGQQLTPAEVQVMPDEADASAAPFRPFTLVPFESVYLLVTSPTVCGAEQNSLRLRYSMLGISRDRNVPFPGPVTVAKFRCPWVEPLTPSPQSGI